MYHKKSKDFVFNKKLAHILGLVVRKRSSALDTNIEEG